LLTGNNANHRKVFCVQIITFVCLSIRLHILHTYSSQIVSTICSFLCAVLAARMLGAAGQGELALYTNFVGISTLIFGFGLPPAIVHFIASGKVKLHEVSSFLLCLMLVCVTSLGIAFFIVGMQQKFYSILPTIFSLQSAWILLLLLHLFFFLSLAFLQAILQAKEKFKIASRIQIVGSLFLLFCYASKYFYHLVPAISPFIWILLSLCISIFIQVVFSWLFLKEEFMPMSLLAFSCHKMLPFFQFAGLAYCTNTIQFLSYRMDIWLLHYYHGSKETGIYALAVSLVQMIWLLPSAMQTVIYSNFSKSADMQMNYHKTIQLTKQIALYALLIGLVAFPVAYALVPIFFGMDFKASVSIIGILLFGIVPFCLSMGISAFFAAHNKVKYNLHAALIGFVICIVFNYYFIPPLGMKGAAYASILSYNVTLLYMCIRFYFLKKESALQQRNINA
jgi:O-antigen/teichoic acid export membrane protein